MGIPFIVDLLFVPLMIFGIMFLGKRFTEDGKRMGIASAIIGGAIFCVLSNVFYVFFIPGGIFNFLFEILLLGGVVVFALTRPAEEPHIPTTGKKIKRAPFILCGVLFSVAGFMQFVIGCWNPYMYYSPISVYWFYGNSFLNCAAFMLLAISMFKRRMGFWTFFAFAFVAGNYLIEVFKDVLLYGNSFSFVNLVTLLWYGAMAFMAAATIWAPNSKFSKILNVSTFVPLSGFLLTIRNIYFVVECRAINFPTSLQLILLFIFFEGALMAAMIMYSIAMKNAVNAPQTENYYTQKVCQNQPVYAVPTYQQTYEQPQTYAQPAYQQTYAPQPAYTQPVQSAPASQENIPAELRRYKQLFDEGVITEEEFTAKKKQILGL